MTAGILQHENKLDFQVDIPNLSLSSFKFSNIYKKVDF